MLVFYGWGVLTTFIILNHFKDKRVNWWNIVPSMLWVLLPIIWLGAMVFDSDTP